MIYGAIAVPGVNKSNESCRIAGVDVSRLCGAPVVNSRDFIEPIGVITRVVKTPDFIAIEADLLNVDLPFFLGYKGLILEHPGTVFFALAGSALKIEEPVKKGGSRIIMDCIVKNVALTTQPVHKAYAVYPGRLFPGFVPSDS